MDTDCCDGCWDDNQGCCEDDSCTTDQGCC